MAEVCRECSAPLSPAVPGQHQAAAHDVETGASRGFLTTTREPLHHAATIIPFDTLTPEKNPVREARIRAVLNERWRAGVDLPSHAAWPSGLRLPAGSRLLPGKALADRRDIGLGEAVDTCLDGPDRGLPVELRPPCADVIGAWHQLRGRTQIGAIVAAPEPSHPVLAVHTARGLARLLNVEYAGELTGIEPVVGPEESSSRVKRLAAQLRLDPALVDVGQIAGRHVLLVGLTWSEGWTMTVSGQLLLSAGALSVRPFTLGIDTRRSHRRSRCRSDQGQRPPRTVISRGRRDPSPLR